MNGQWSVVNGQWSMVNRYIILFILSLAFIGIQIHPTPSYKPAKYELFFVCFVLSIKLYSL